MSDISTLITNEIRTTLENLSRKGVGFINLESTDAIQYQIDNRIFDITVKEHDRQNARFIGKLEVKNCYLLIENNRIDDIINHNYQSQYNELAFIRRLLGVQKTSNFYLNFVQKENMGFMIYEICYSALMNQILK